jgi:ribonucleoside-diphosphate reductase alpha chain
MQRLVQGHIDNAVSKTINLPKDYPIDRLGEDLLEALPHIKGSTFYREGSRPNEPLQHVPADRVLETELEFHRSREAR